MKSNKMSIQVNHISKYYGKQAALHDVSFEIPKGQVVGLLGPNGAGKSTMMKILAGFIPPSAGTAQIDGIDVAHGSLDTRRLVGYLPEHNPLYLDMYVREYLHFVAGIYRLGKEANHSVEQVIHLTGLDPEGHKKIGQLSKGYRQRVGLAQALVHNPSVLILDEPTSGLDPNQLADIRALISQVGKEKTVILSTHIMQEVEAVCGMTLIIDHGRIVAYDTPQHIQRAAQHAQAVLIGFAQGIDIAHYAQAGFVDHIESLGNHRYILHSSIAPDIRPMVFDLAVSLGHTLIELSAQTKQLEDVFRDLTRKTTTL